MRLNIDFLPSVSDGLSCPTCTLTCSLPVGKRPSSCFSTTHRLWYFRNVDALYDAFSTSLSRIKWAPIRSSFERRSWSNTRKLIQPSILLTASSKNSFHSGLSVVFFLLVSADRNVSPPPNIDNSPRFLLTSNLCSPTMILTYGSEEPFMSMASRSLAQCTLINTLGFGAYSKSSNPSWYQLRTHVPVMPCCRESQPAPSKTGSPFSHAISAFRISCSSLMSHGISEG
mmetsp:Transcript_73119/g.107300  ORF Transcript_73119/g.107300 Transcript_73119/m.107300 type:complete len:228 (-) Transcript_73119:324-1007(-)